VTVTTTISARQENHGPDLVSSVNTPRLRQWVPAAKLKYGEHLNSPDGVTAVVTGGITPKQHDGWMWDLTIPGNDDHDFYVISAQADGSHGAHHAEADDVPVLVHNASCPTFVSNALSDLLTKRITTGRMFSSSGTAIGPEITSGSDALSASAQSSLESSPNIGDIPPGATYASSTHVETKFAQLMEQAGITDSDVVINNPTVCSGPMSCRISVPAVLSRGSTMRVWYPGSNVPITLEGAAGS
jgi:SCP1.201-like deaminase